jgi:hypothetical protein
MGTKVLEMSRGSRLAVSGVALTALLVLVAVASRAHRPGGSSGASTPGAPALFFDYVASAMLVLFPLGVLVVVWAMAQGRHQRLLAQQTTWRKTLATVAIGLGLLAAAVYLRPGHGFIHRFGARPAVSPSGHTQPVKPGKTKEPRPLYHSQFRWLPALLVGSIVLALAFVAAAAYVRKRRGGDAWEREAALAAALDEVLADTLQDLRTERDPRRAVIRTYSRMEQTFAAYGVAREEAEAPLEYLGRVLDRLSVSVYSVRRLTQLFARAKFSEHQVDARMKDEAIEALVGLRAELEHGRQDAKPTTTEAFA